MHEKIRLVHVSLDKRLVLLGIATTDDQVVLTGYKPYKLLEPEDLPSYCLYHLLLLELCEVSRCCCLSLLYGNVRRSFSLHLLLIRLFLDLEVLLNVELR